MGLGLIHGFENSWGPFQILDADQESLAYLLHLHRFFSEIVTFDQLRPAPDLLMDEGYAPGYRPLLLADEKRTAVAVYFPAGGQATLNLPADVEYGAQWFDPIAGGLSAAEDMSSSRTFASPADTTVARPQDWVLLLTDTEGKIQP